MNKQSFSSNKHSFSSNKKSTYTKIKINWRAMWYSVLVWLLAVVVSSLVILPWYYLVLPFAVFWTTVIYFRSGDKSFERGLWIALFWFAIVAGLDILEIIGPYYRDVTLYFSDFRNWIKYVLILLIPAIYGLVQENIKLKKTFKGKFPQEFSQELPTEA